MPKNQISYSDSGVDIAAGNKLVDDIKSDISLTNRSGVMDNIGGFGGLFDLKSCGYKDPILVAATDGVGTKLKIAIDAENYDTIGQDLVAMCVNDLIVQGAEPLFFLDYYACGKLRADQAKQVITSIAQGCKIANCALIGGETAEMPNMYHGKDIDLAGFAIGAVERDNILPQKDQISAGDLILSLPSSGIHSNGYSLVRKIMDSYNIDYNDIAEFDKNLTYRDAFLIPTKIYVTEALALHKANLVKAFCHITGGGLLENLPRVLPDHLDFELDFTAIELPAIFTWLKNKSNVDNQEFFKTFNCGTGMAVIIKPSNYAKVANILKQHGYDNIAEIGKIITK